MIKVGVGSQNPVKLRATKKVFSEIFGKKQKIKIVSVKADSGVFHTPSSIEEIIQGAINRANEAIKKTRADFGVGLEGGYYKTKFGYFLKGVAVIVNKEGKIGIGGGNEILLPKKIVQELKRKKELGEIIDELKKEKNTKQKLGAVGFLLKGKFNRQKSFEIAILSAFARFLRGELYENSKVKI